MPSVEIHHGDTWAELVSASVMFPSNWKSKRKANAWTHRRERTEQDLEHHFVLICNRDKAISIQGKTGVMIFADSSVCPGLPAQHIHLRGVLGSAQTFCAGEVNIICINIFGLWARKGRGAGSVGLWVWDCKETRLRAGGAQGTGKGVGARLWTHMNPVPYWVWRQMYHQSKQTSRAKPILYQLGLYQLRKCFILLNELTISFEGSSVLKHEGYLRKILLSWFKLLIAVLKSLPMTLTLIYYSRHSSDYA